jgi:hypothetical protein
MYAFPEIVSEVFLHRFTESFGLAFMSLNRQTKMTGAFLARSLRP